MGNNCVAGGGTPHRHDIQIINNTNIHWKLDTSIGCGRDCKHEGFNNVHVSDVSDTVSDVSGIPDTVSWTSLGFKVVDGKIVEGHSPPKDIAPGSVGKFSVSGREATAVAPSGSAYFKSNKGGAKMLVVWNFTGWTTWTKSALSIEFTGMTPVVPGIIYGESGGALWSNILTGPVDIGHL
ncbi:hypothetical protein BC833DRAFT_567798 [Globomyces pollinis-pini]|nr:hypothetical protein BC833DRAFT_567798 [Globomyces pollinis-pini]